MMLRDVGLFAAYRLRRRITACDFLLAATIGELRRLLAIRLHFILTPFEHLLTSMPVTILRLSYAAGAMLGASLYVSRWPNIFAGRACLLSISTLWRRD